MQMKQQCKNSDNKKRNKIKGVLTEHLSFGFIDPLSPKLVGHTT